MNTWAYSFIYADHIHDVTEIWDENIRKKSPIGKNTADLISEYGREGWELVSVTPFATGQGHTNQLLFTFKRPIE